MEHLNDFDTPVDTSEVDKLDVPHVQELSTVDAFAETLTADLRKLTFTAIQGAQPNRLTKVLGLDGEGNLRKEAAAQLVHGAAQTVTVNGLEELRAFLEGLDSSHAVTWGRMHQDAAIICASYDVAAQEQGALPRTRKNFHFGKQPGIMMLDHDGHPEGSLMRDDVRDRLITAAHVLLEAPMLWRPSASAGCVHPDGRELSPLDRHRFYIPVQDASLIPGAGEALVDLIWASGGGWYEVGKAGQGLGRCIVDASVWQPERLDFVGPPVLEDGITRPSSSGVIYGREDHLFDLQKLIALATPEVRLKANAARQAAKAAVREQCRAKAQVWATERAPELAKRSGIEESIAFNTLVRASEGNVLMCDFELICSDGSTVLVSELLDDPTHWHGKEFADPLDPDHDHRVAIAYLTGGRQIIFSHRHGGVTYELKRQVTRVQLAAGQRSEITDEVLSALRKNGELYEYGERALAFIAKGKVSPVSSEWLTDHISRVVSFYGVSTRRDKEGNVTSSNEVPKDAPAYIATAIMAKHDSRDFKTLNGVCTAPILRLDGSIVDSPGYDNATGLIYICNDLEPPTVPEFPSPDDALDALSEMWKPFAEFPFQDDVARGVLLASALSAILRPVLPTCPAFGFDAPSAGSGKTLLAKTIGVLGTGGYIPTLSPAREEEECRKRLFASLRNGDKVLLWDNVREPFGNAAIDTFLTSPSFADRVLGVSETQVLPNKALFLITGNNLVLTGDTHRRVLKARLDAKVEQPFTRQFSFSPDEMVRESRQALVVAGLTIVRAYITAGRPQAASGSVASYEAWDRLVRQPLCWLMQIAAQSGRTDLPKMDDPRLAITSAEAENPEQSKLSAMLYAWHSVFGSAPTPVATAIGQDRYRHAILFDAMDEVAGQNGKINSRVLGRWIERNAEQRKDGMRFVRAGKVHGTVRWQVVVTPPPMAPAGGLGDLGGFQTTFDESNSGPLEGADAPSYAEISTDKAVVDMVDVDEIVAGVAVQTSE